MMEDRKVYPVSVVNRYVKTILNRDDVLSDIWISGEISNFKRHSSGHLYFSVKDPGGAINAVMFSSDARRLRFLPENGTKVQVRGAVTLYEKTGGYQLYVRQMEKEGQGDLYQAFEMLKEKLSSEGLFDAGRKKPLPAFPRKIGIVTSPTGAAVRDIIQISKRRFPGVQLVLYPALVQGEFAAASIVKGIRTLDAMEDVDVLIVGRGGGSMEDLWPFNEEIVARSIAACKTPVVSAVGHETDFTIADFVSDLRAPTPSAAAELAVPDIVTLLSRIEADQRKREALLGKEIRNLRMKLTLLGGNLEHISPENRIRQMIQNVDLMLEQMDRSVSYSIEIKQKELQRLSGVLELSSPMFPLTKGYAMIEGEKGKILTDVDEVEEGSMIRIRMKSGSVDAEVKKKEWRSIHE